MIDVAPKSELARRYPATSPLFIGRLINACRIEYIQPAVGSYLDKDSTVVVLPELVAAFVEQLRELQHG